MFTTSLFLFLSFFSIITKIPQETNKATVKSITIVYI